MQLLTDKCRLYWRDIVSPTIVATLILLVTIWLFGLENSMIAPFATISYLRVINMKYHYECMIKHFLRYGITAAAAYVAGISLPLCILVNAAALFIITFYLIDEYHPVNHLPIGMALIFFQIAQIHTPAALGKRLGALAVSFMIIFVFVLVITLRDRKKDRFTGLLESGFQYAGQLLDVCRKYHAEKNAPETEASALQKNCEDRIRTLHLKMRANNRQLSEEIYACNRAAFFKKGKINFYCRFVILFQVINYLTKYYQDPANIALAADMLKDYKTLYTSWKPEPDYFMLRLRSDRLNIRDFQFRYALRMVIAMTPCMVFGYLAEIPNVYWLAFSLFYMITPSSDDTMKEVYKRTAGTFAGIVISLVLFAVFPDLTARIIITAVLNLFIYASKHHIFSVAYITCATLAMQTYDLGNAGSMFRCLIFTLAGALIALLVNRFVFQVHTQVQMDLIVGYMEKIRTTLKQLSCVKTENTGTDRPGKGYLMHGDWQEERYRRRLTDELCIRSYLLTARLQELDESQPAEKRHDYFELEKAHMNDMAAVLVNLLAKPGNRQGL